MVEAVANFPQIKMEVFVGYATVRIQPVLGIVPEAFDPVDMIPADRDGLRSSL